VALVLRARSPILAAVAALTLALGVGGCIFGGGGGPDDAVTDFADAIADGDFEKACSYLSEDLQSQAEAAGGCESALETALSSEEDIADAESLEAEVVEESDDAATVETTSEGEDPETVELTKEDGDWKISGLP
jgi:Domain of unknown function (DUF4878)